MTKLKSINDQIKYYYILTTIAILVKGSISPPNISANSTLRLVTASKWYFTIPECLKPLSLLHSLASAINDSLFVHFPTPSASANIKTVPGFSMLFAKSITFCRISNTNKACKPHSLPLSADTRPSAVCGNRPSSQ